MIFSKITPPCKLVPFGKRNPVQKHGSFKLTAMNGTQLLFVVDTPDGDWTEHHLTLLKRFAYLLGTEIQESI